MAVSVSRRLSTLRAMRTLLLIALTGFGSQVHAQIPLGLVPPLDSEVRVLVREDAETRRVHGWLDSASASELVLRDLRGRQRWTVPAETVAGLERAAGRNHLRGAAKGLLWGTLVGALVGGTVISIASAGDCLSDVTCSEFEKFAIFAVFGIYAGAPTGTVFGLLVGSRNWERVW